MLYKYYKSVNGQQLDNHRHNVTTVITVLIIILYILGNFIDYSFYSRGQGRSG